MTKPLFTGTSWNEQTIRDIVEAVYQINDEELGLDIFPNQFEIVSSDQMLDAYSSTGLPINYKHWSFGKSFLREEELYRKGKRGLAYEMVISSSPCLNYLMDDNTACVQAVVIGHAGIFHNSFFKNNYLFKEWSDAEGIIDYLVFAKNYIRQCEEKYGQDEVEKVLDSAHALRYQGVDRYKRPKPLNTEQEKKRQEEREEYLRKNADIILGEAIRKPKEEDTKRFPKEPYENLLKFIEKHSPVLETWQREILRIVRKLSTYFWGNIQTQTTNEGWATFGHTYIMNRLYEKGLITEGAMLEFFDVNSGVVYQHPYSNFNPYALGYNMFKDIKRMCEEPTKEDEDWFPHLVGKPWLEEVKNAAFNYRDESFIKQYLSPKLIRDFRIFSLKDLDDYYRVEAIQDEKGYKEVRKNLSKSREIGNIIPEINVVDSNLSGNRKLILHHNVVDGQLLDNKTSVQCKMHIRRLWGFDVDLLSVDKEGNELWSY